jgi:hypothetical protein
MLRDVVFAAEAVAASSLILGATLMDPALGADRAVGIEPLELEPLGEGPTAAAARISRELGAEGFGSDDGAAASILRELGDAPELELGDAASILRELGTPLELAVATPAFAATAMRPELVPVPAPMGDFGPERGAVSNRLALDA